MDLKNIKVKPLIRHYGITTIITFVYYVILYLLFTLGEETIVPYPVTYGIMLLGTASSVSFTFFFTRYKQCFNDNNSAGMVAPFLYGAAVYFFISSSSVSSLIVYALFPIVVVSVVNMMEKSKSLPVIILVALLTVVSPRDMIPLILVSLVIIFVLCVNMKNDGAFFFIRFFFAALLGLMIGAFRLFSKFADYRMQSLGYQGFFVSYYPAVISCMLFVGIILYIIDKQNNNRLMYCVLYGFLLLVRSISPLSHLFSFGVYEYNNREAYDVIIVFVSICLACKGIAYYTKGIADISKICILGVLISLFTFIMQRAFENGFRGNVLVVISLIVGNIFVLLFCLNKGCNRIIISCMLFLLIFAEVFVNTMIFSGQQYLCDGGSLVESSKEAFEGFWGVFSNDTQLKFEIDNTKNAVGNEAGEGVIAEYKDFYKDHYDPEVTYLVAMVDKYIDISEEEKRQFNAENGDRFEVINAKCKKAGVNGEVFTPIEGYNLIFEESDMCRINNVASGLYNFECMKNDNEEIVVGEDGFCYASFVVDSNERVLSDNCYLYIESSDLFLHLNENDLNGTEKLYIRFQPQEYVDINLRFPMYKTDDTEFKLATETVVKYINETRNDYIHYTDIVGLIVSLIGLIITLICFWDIKGKRYIDVVDRKIACFVESKELERIKNLLSENRIYILAFIIPFLVILSNLAIYNCIPFGNNFIFDSDGIQITLPSYLELGNVLRKDSLLFSIAAGYGYGFFAPNLLSFAFMPLKNMSARWGMTFLSLGEAGLFGLAGLTMAVFLVNRRYGEKADRRDAGILFATVAYSCNYFFLSMHSYNEWYINYALLPLVILGLEKMIKERKPLLYWLTLMLTTVNSIQPAMYVCIFVFIWFMFIEHKGIIDFIRNAFYVAIISILAILPGIGLMYTAIWGTNDSHYREEDSIFPKLGFHKSFFDQWKSFFIFSSTDAVSTDDGGLSAYIGILILVIIVIFVIFKRNNIRQKIRLLGPAIVILLSMNGRVLSFVWNGFHYQSNVPNRYAFLLMFLLAIMAYEGVSNLKDIKTKEILISFAAVFAFIILCFSLGKEKSDLPAIASLIILVIWFVIFGIIMKKGSFSLSAKKALLMLCVLEMFIGSVYAWSRFGVSEVAMYGNIDAEREMIGNVKDQEGVHRATFPNSGMLAGGMIYDIPSIAFFSPYVSRHQTNQAYLFGYIDGINWILDRTDSTPVSNSLEATDTLLFSKYTLGAPLDLDCYDYIGETERFYIYRNPNALSIGMFVPENIFETIEYYSNTPTMINEMVQRCLKNDNKLYDIDVLSIDDSEISFLNYKNETISEEKAKSIFDSQTEERVTSNIPELRLRIDFVPKSTGWAYLFNDEMIPLGYVNKGERFSIEMPYPNTRAYATAFNVAIMNDSVYDEFIEFEKKNQLEETSYSHDAIRGVANYEDDGYTMFSIAYNPHFKAYIDGEEVPIEDLLDSVIFVRTPAGKHVVELKYRPEGLILAMKISAVALVIGVIFVILCEAKMKRCKNEE